MIPHERISGDYRQNKHDLRSKLSQSSHSSPSPLLGVKESLPSTSSGNAKQSFFIYIVSSFPLLILKNTTRQVRVPGFRVPSSGFQVPESNFRVPNSGLRTLFHG
ncbi:hypothetical protein Avbf_07750 [Armadillidium vulgare]|nr:hypothetical protein Avbf_07750 [Armadillidium vulgare]